MTEPRASYALPAEVETVTHVERNDDGTTTVRTRLGARSMSYLFARAPGILVGDTMDCGDKTVRYKVRINWSPFDGEQDD